MQINWITVAAQVVNFLVLVWLLRRFLYRPILEAMARREKHIFERLNDAEQRELAANNKIQEYTAAQISLMESREHELSLAKEQAEKKRSELLQATQLEVEQKRLQWLADLESERSDYLGKVRDFSIEAVQQFTRQTLEDLANTELESEIINVFLQQLTTMESETRRLLLRSNRPLLVNSSFSLHTNSKENITNTIQKQLGEGVEIQFAQSAKLICGLELRSSDYHIGWTLANHLDKLDASIEKALGK